MIVQNQNHLFESESFRVITSILQLKLYPQWVHSILEETPAVRLISLIEIIIKLITVSIIVITNNSSVALPMVQDSNY